jgi:alkylhydroperoxidase family enzyme
VIRNTHRRQEADTPLPSCSAGTDCRDRHIERLYGSEEATLWKLRQVDGEAIVLRIAAERHSLEVVSFIRWRLRDEIWSATLAKHR